MRRIPHPLVYQRVKETLVARFPHDHWDIRGDELDLHLRRALDVARRQCPLCADSGYRQVARGQREEACECAVGRNLFNTLHVGEE